MLKVLIADDHAIVRKGLKEVLRESAEPTSVGEARDGDEALAKIQSEAWDVVVLDITMPGLDGIQAARQLLRIACRAKLVFLTVHDDPDYVRAALDAGGTAYVAKARLASDLIPAINASLLGERFLSPTLHLGEKP